MIDTWKKLEQVFDLPATSQGLKTLVCSGQPLRTPPEQSQHRFTLLSSPYALPELGYKKQAFHLALCAEFLFWYSDLLSEDFHVTSLLSFCRVATEVQIYPVVDRWGAPSPHLGNVLQRLQAAGIGAEIKSLEAPLKGKDNALLRLWTETCTVRPKKVSTVAS